MLGVGQASRCGTFTSTQGKDFRWGACACSIAFRTIPRFSVHFQVYRLLWMGFQIGKVQGNTGNILFTYWNVLVVSTILDTMTYNYIYTSFTYVLYKIDSNFPEGLMFPAPRTNPDFIPSVRRHVKWSRLIRFYPNTSFDEALVTSHFHVDFLDLATVNSECIPEVKVAKVRLWLVTSFSCQGVHASMQASQQAAQHFFDMHRVFSIEQWKPRLIDLYMG